MSLFCWTQRKIFWRMWETEQFWGTIDLHSIFFPTMEVNGAPKQPGYKLSSKLSSFCSAEQRHSYSLGTTWGWVNDDKNCHFWVNYPFKDWFVLQGQHMFSDMLTLQFKSFGVCKTFFLYIYIYVYMYMFLKEISYVHPGFNVTRSFRNHFNMLICCSMLKIVVLLNNFLETDAL